MFETTIELFNEYREKMDNRKVAGYSPGVAFQVCAYLVLLDFILTRLVATDTIARRAAEVDGERDQQYHDRLEARERDGDSACERSITMETNIFEEFQVQTDATLEHYC